MIQGLCCFIISTDAFAFSGRVDRQHVGSHRPLSSPIKIARSQKDSSSGYRVHYFSVLTTLQCEILLSKILPRIIVMQNVCCISLQNIIKENRETKGILSD